MPMPNTYYPDEIVFMKQNFFSMTNSQLLEEINANRQNHIRLPGLIHQFRRLGLRREIQIRWSKTDISFLKKHFHLIGDMELAEMLTERCKTCRVINHKKVYRKFTHKHIEKKRGLLNLKRTELELIAIKKRNIASGRVPVLTSQDNYWTRGIRVKAQEEDIRLWRDQTGRLLRFIKINSSFIPYTRWFYQNFIGPVPKNCKVYHIDLDSINDDPANLEVRPYSRTGFKEYTRALSLIRTRLNNHLKQKYSTREEETEWHKQLSHLRIIDRHIKAKIDFITNRKYSIYKEQTAVA